MTGGGTVVRTPVEVVREVESYDVTVSMLDRTGNPTDRFGAMPGGCGTFSAAMPTTDTDDSMRFRVPRGQYNLAAELRADDSRMDSAGAVAGA